MSSKHILVTGATGLVGYAVVNQLVDRGYHPLLLVRSESSAKKFDYLGTKVTILKIDFTHSKEIIHLAEQIRENYNLLATIYALGATQASNAQAYNFINAEILKSLLILFKQNGTSLGKLIFVSSLSLHGVNRDTDYQITIDTTFEPLTDYARSKILAEHFLKLYSDDYIIIRPAAIFGQYDKQMIIIHRLIRKGWHIHLGSKKNKVGVIHAKDLAIHMLTYIGSTKKNIIVTSCTHNVSVHQYFETVASAYGTRRKFTLVFPKWFLYALAVVNEFFGRLLLARMPVFNRQKVAELVGGNWTCNTKDFTSTLHITKPQYSFEQRIQETANWYINNKWI